MTLQNIEEWYKENTEREKKNEWKMEYWYWLSDIQLEQKYSYFLLLLLERLYQFIKMFKENEREKWVCKCNHFFFRKTIYITYISVRFRMIMKEIFWWFTELENTISLQNNDRNCETGIEFLSLKHSYI